MNSRGPGILMASPIAPLDALDPVVDVVIPVYSERSEVLAATLSAFVKQTLPATRIFVVDDCFPQHVSLPDWARSSPHSLLLRLPENVGISAARNAGIARSDAPLLACINTEVLPGPDWLATCVSCLLSQPGAGACYTRLVSATPRRLLTRWRMRSLETRFETQSGFRDFAPGHAVLFRREALDAVGGYDARHRLHHEDSDVCRRMQKSGWRAYYVAESRCVSIQKDTLKQLAVKELRESYWYSPARRKLLAPPLSAPE